MTMPGLFGHSRAPLMSFEFDGVVIVFSRIRNGHGNSLFNTQISEKSTMNNKKGFTLIELLIVVVIIGILAAIAIPKFANTKDKAYVAAMKSDLRNLATYEEQYAADQNGAYFAGTATMAAPLNGFTPSQNVTITAVIVAGPPQSWTASATHAQSAKTCDNSTGAIVCT
jgi:prepilin-type N-terminal cleavage/methylation domain-containing protein